MPQWTIYPPARDAGRSTTRGVRSYFDDPEVIWLDAPGVIEDSFGKPTQIPASGYYVVNVCGNIHCCFPFGPFVTAEEAREWSRNNLPEGADSHAGISNGDTTP